MSDQLQALGVTLFSGYAAENLSDDIECVIVGNAMKRGNPEMEAVFNKELYYISGPQWLFENVLRYRWVLAVSGTHGKTTTTSLLTWILDFAGRKPGFLIGGVPENFGVSASLGESPFFVIEADEYDCALFDKRSKFLHYRPKTLILNNLEFDHAYIFKDLDQIKTQFHHLIRTVPGEGLIVSNGGDENLKDVLSKGVWTPVECFVDQKAWHAVPLKTDGSIFDVYFGKIKKGTVHGSLLGEHNVQNALAAIAAAHHAGVEPSKAIEALTLFKNVKRRMEVKGEFQGVTLYDDFAHHPTAIYHTLQGLRKHVGQARILVILEFGSYTMRSGCHKPAAFQPALSGADKLFLKQPAGQDWDAKQIISKVGIPSEVFTQMQDLVSAVQEEVRSGDHVLVMSNTGFEGIFDKLEKALKEKEYAS